MKKTVQIESALASIIAGWTGRTLDVDIMRGTLPARMYNVAAVRIISETKSRYQYLRNLSAQIVGKFESRDDAQELIDGVIAKLPAGNTVLGDIEFTYMECDFANEPFVLETDGRTLWAVSLNIQFSVRDC